MHPKDAKDAWKATFGCKRCKVILPRVLQKHSLAYQTRDCYQIRTGLLFVYALLVKVSLATLITPSSNFAPSVVLLYFYIVSLKVKLIKS